MAGRAMLVVVVVSCTAGMHDTASSAARGLGARTFAPPRTPAPENYHRAYLLPVTVMLWLELLGLKRHEEHRLVLRP